MNFKYKFFTLESYTVGVTNTLYIMAVLPLLGTIRLSHSRGGEQESFILYRTTKKGDNIIYMRVNSEGLSGKWIKYLTRGESNEIAN